MEARDMTEENCLNHCNKSSNIMSVPSDTDMHKVSSMPLPATPGSKRRGALPSALRSSRTSARKLRKIEEDELPKNVNDNGILEPETGPSVSDMNNRIKQLFPEERVLKLPCTSARVFACFSLAAETTVPTVVKGTPRRSTRRQKSQGSLEPIMPFLKALVHVEVSSLDMDATESLATPARPRRIAFSGFDCSSTKPPVDRIDGSGEHQSNLIHALSSAKIALDTLIADKKKHVMAIQCLEKLTAFLTRTFDNDESLQRSCAASISPFYPMERFRKPVQLYAGEFGGLIRRLQQQPSSLFVESQLNELLCNSIRYHLRLLLNPPPPRLTPLDENYEQRSKSFSRIHELVEMKVVDDKKKQEPVDGERVASLVNEALVQICHFFGASNLLDTVSGIPAISANFCQSEASQRQIPRNNKIRLPPLSPVEVAELRDDMNYAFQVLTTLNAVNFLLDLMSLPKVVAEIKRLGGWGDVETYATLLWRYELWEIRPDNEHFVLLSNFKTLSERLVSIQAVLLEPGEVAKVSLKDLGDRFRVNAIKKNKAILRQNYPEISIVDEALAEGWKAARAFPTVRGI